MRDLFSFRNQRAQQWPLSVTVFQKTPYNNSIEFTFSGVDLNTFRPTNII